MRGELRIRDFVQAGSNAAYPNIEDASGTRSMVRASATRPASGNRMECITFVKDTFHNRCMLLINRDIEEVAEYVDGEGWKRISRDWADSVFAPCVGEETLPATDPGAGSEPVLDIRGIEDVLALPKPEQYKVISQEGCPKALLQAVANCADERLSKKVRQYAEDALKDLEDEDSGPAADGSDDAGAPD